MLGAKGGPKVGKALALADRSSLGGGGGAGGAWCTEMLFPRWEVRGLRRRLGLGLRSLITEKPT